MTMDIYEDTLYGQIMPFDWDNESVSGVTILVDGEDEFVVENDENAELLLDYIDRWVTVEGVITENGDDLRIKVRNYTIEDGLDYDGDSDW